MNRRVLKGAAAFAVYLFTSSIAFDVFTRMRPHLELPLIATWLTLTYVAMRNIHDYVKGRFSLQPVECG